MAHCHPHGEEILPVSSLENFYLLPLVSAGGATVTSRTLEKARQLVAFAEDSASADVGQIWGAGPAPGHADGHAVDIEWTSDDMAAALLDAVRQTREIWDLADFRKCSEDQCMLHTGHGNCPLGMAQTTMVTYIFIASPNGVCYFNIFLRFTM